MKQSKKAETSKKSDKPATSSDQPLEDPTSSVSSRSGNASKLSGRNAKFSILVAEADTEAKGTSNAKNDRDLRIIRLLELMHKIQSAEDAERPLRGLFLHLQKEFPHELLPVLRRVSSWNQSPYSSFLYAKAAFESKQPKLAYKILSPHLEKSDASESALVLGARICKRIQNKSAAEEFLKRIPASSRRSKTVEQLKKSLKGTQLRKKTKQTKSS